MKRNARDHKEPGAPAATHCTACNAPINFKRSTPYRHAILDVLVCKKCRDFYGNGEWTRDENGQDEYCRWCAEGGVLYICCNDDCLSGFCRKCIKRNFDATECEDVENDDDWRCYICNPKKLKALQKEAKSVLEKLEEERRREKLEEEESQVEDRSNEVSKQNGAHSPSPQSTFKDLLDALREASSAESSGPSLRDQAKVRTVWHNLKPRLLSLGKAIKGSDFSEAAELVGGFIDSAPLPRSLPRPPSPAFSRPSASPQPSRSPSPRSSRSASSPPDNSARASSPSSPLDNSARAPSPSPPPRTQSPPRPGSHASSASPSARAPPKPGAFTTSTPTPSSKRTLAILDPPFPPQSPIAEVPEGDESPPETSAVPRERVQQSVEAALQKLVEVSRGTAQNVSSTNPSRDSPFRDSEDESEKSESPPSGRRAKKSDSNAKTVPCVGEKVKVKSEPPDEDQTSPDQIAGVPESEHDVVGERNVEAGPSQAPPIRTERLSPSDDDRIIWGNLTIRDFVANRLEVRVERLETLLDKEDAPKAITTGSQDSDEEEAYVDDPELLKLLKDPLRRRRLRRNIRHAVAKRKPVLKSSPEKGSKQRKVPESDSGDDDSDVSCASHDTSDDSLRPSMSNALVLGRSSNEDEIMPSQPGSDSDDDIQIIGEQKAPRRKKAKKEVVSSDSEGDAKTVARNGVEDDDSDEDRAPIKRRAIPAIVNDEPSTSKRRRAQKNCDSDESLAKRRKTKRRKVRIIDSDEEEAGSDEKMAELSPLVSDSGSELEEPERPKRKKKSKKKKNAVEGSDSEQGEDESGEKKKERSMRKIISDDKVEKESRAAAKEEAERRKRVLERQKLYNEIEAEMQKERKTDKVTRCVLEYDPTSKEPMVEVDEALVRSMKPHQVDGVKFLYNTLIESVEHVVKGKPGGGAILAHCMGLGKTFQTICLLHTLLTHKVLSQHIKRIIVVCPCNVVLNWAREFEMWVEENMDVKGDIPVYEFSRVKNVPDRMYLLEDWYKSGGVLIIGYSMFRLMSQNKTKSRKVKDRLPKLLHDPGADVVVCDEGHMLKSGKAQISQAMNLIKTQRRLILTGTPLQNNMSEYHCMVSFVKPNLLGTPKEFSNRFMNPITYGQEANASSYAVRLMKKRVHILNKLLAGCVHRCDYSHLTPYLPTKFEYIISIELSELQKKLYREYLKHIGVTEETTREDLRCRSLLKDYQTLKMVWSHPYLLMQSEDRQEDRRQKEAYKNQMDEFVVEGSEEDSDVSQSGSGTSENGDGSDKEEVVKTYKTRRNRRENPEVESEPEEDIAKKKYDKTWWVSHVPEDEDDFISLGLSSKLSMAFQILRECELIGDKVILFSTSLLTLSLFERNLHIEYQKTSSETAEGDYINSWVHGLDYFRLDGSTSVDARKRYIDHFNDPNNLRARLFLVSTKAGGIGTNMIGANRIIVLDASWNPSDDTQAIFRAFRYGQVKPVYVYRLLAHATMEEKIYDRQVNKISLASRVVDEQNLERHFNESDLKALYEFKPEKDARKTPAVPKDRLLAELLMTQKTLIQGYHEHDSLLQKELEDELTEEERKQAWKEYEDERDGKAPPQMPYQMPGPYGNIPGFTGTMPGYTGTLPGGIPGGLPGGIPGMPNFPGGIHRMPGFGIPGTSGANQWTAQMAQQFMAQLAARARLPNNASYAAHQNQFMPRAAQRPAGNMNFQQRPPTNPSFLPRQGNIPNPTTEEILSRPPHFDANLNHPTLNPKKMLEDIKLKYPNDHQVSIAARWRSALKTARDKYAASLTRLKQTIEVHQKLGRALPLDAFRTQEECESAVKICDHLVIGLENSYQRFRQDVATEQRKAASSSRPTVIDLDSPSKKNTTGRTGPIIEEIE